MVATFSSVTMVVARAPISRTSPMTAGDFDPVSHFEGPLEEQDEAAEEVAGDVLQAEAEADTDGAHQDVERREIDAGAL
jgi:hypothetical protein